MFKVVFQLRCATQELVWQSVLRAIESDPDSMTRINGHTRQSTMAHELNDAIAMQTTPRQWMFTLCQGTAKAAWETALKRGLFMF